MKRHAIVRRTVDGMKAIGALILTVALVLAAAPADAKRDTSWPTRILCGTCP